MSYQMWVSPNGWISRFHEPRGSRDGEIRCFPETYKIEPQAPDPPSLRVSCGSAFPKFREFPNRSLIVVPAARTAPGASTRAVHRT
ncbi:MAG: hypothetical protein ACHQK9_01240 [Reyranellales bacterium]